MRLPKLRIKKRKNSRGYLQRVPTRVTHNGTAFLSYYFIDIPGRFVVLFELDKYPHTPLLICSRSTPQKESAIFILPDGYLGRQFYATAQPGILKWAIEKGTWVYTPRKRNKPLLRKMTLEEYGFLQDQDGKEIKENSLC